jgi:hypothetical protein
MSEPDAVVLDHLHVSRVRDPRQPPAQLTEQIHTRAGLGQHRSHLANQPVEPGATVGAARPVVSGDEWHRFHE